MRSHRRRMHGEPTPRDLLSRYSSFLLLSSSPFGMCFQSFTGSNWSSCELRIFHLLLGWRWSPALGNFGVSQSIRVHCANLSRCHPGNEWFDPWLVGVGLGLTETHDRVSPAPQRTSGWWSVGFPGRWLKRDPSPPAKRGQESWFLLVRPATDANEPHRCLPCGAFCRHVSSDAESAMAPANVLILAVLAGPVRLALPSI